MCELIGELRGEESRENRIGDCQKRRERFDEGRREEKKKKKSDMAVDITLL